jgi:hypothetical protein
MNRPATIVRRSESGNTDDCGNDIPQVDEVDFRCELQQAARSETPDMGEVSDTTWKLFAPVDTDLRTGDAVYLAGTYYEVIGAPWRADTGSAAVHHVEATLRLTEGQPR